MEMIAPIIIAVLSSSVLNSILAFIFAQIKEKNDKNSKSVRAERLTLLFIIKSCGIRHIKDGNISETDFKALEETYNLYKELGGDGYADKIFNSVKELDII